MVYLWRVQRRVDAQCTTFIYSYAEWYWVRTKAASTYHCERTLFIKYVNICT